LRADLRLLVRRKDVDHTINRLRGTVGMKRPKNQVARLRDRNRSGNRFKVTHLTNKHNIRVLTETRAESRRETVGIIVDFTLYNHGLLRLMSKLNWILNGDDVLGTFFVNLVDQRRQRRRLTRTSRAGNQDEATGKVRKA